MGIGPGGVWDPAICNRCVASKGTSTFHRDQIPRGQIDAVMDDKRPRLTNCVCFLAKYSLQNPAAWV